MNAEKVKNSPHDENSPESTCEINQVETEQNKEQYILPPRSTRGIPLRRFNLKYEAQWSKYPINAICKGCLTQGATIYNAALYSEKNPTIIEEALKSKNWKKDYAR